MRCTPPLALILALAACGGGSTPAPVPEAPPAPEVAPATADDGVRPPGDRSLPDIVIVTLDTTRADHLGLYGYPRATSPHLDALGAESIVFERFIVPMATTLPTHTSLFTAVWPDEHGILANLKHGGERFVPSEQLIPFAAWARQLGYHTGAFVSAAVLRAQTGISAGFDTFDEPRRAERRAEPTLARAREWLDAAPTDRPLLLWVHLFDPHNPYAPPPEWRQRFLDRTEAIDAWLAPRAPAERGTRPTGEVVITHDAINLYDAEIAYMDAQLGPFLDALRARERWPATALVVAGDHGEGLNQHGEPGHGQVWDEQLHAPLMIRTPVTRARRVPAVLSAADVLPTLLGQLALPDTDRFLEQASGLDVLHPAFSERAVLSRTSDRQASFGRDVLYAWTDGRTVCHGPDVPAPPTAEGEPAPPGTSPSRLFNLALDPHQLSPIDDPARLDACLGMMRGEIARQRQRRNSLGAGVTEKMDATEIEALRALGYVDDVAPPEPPASSEPAQPTTP